MATSFHIKNKKQLFDDLDIFEKEINELNTDVINAVVLQIAQNSNAITLKSTEAKIVADMNKPSMSGGTLGEALVNSKRKSNGLSKLKGPPLHEAVEKLIAAKIFSITYLKSGWMPSIKYLDKLLKRSKYYSIIKRYQFEIDPLTKNVGTDKGDVVYAKVNATSKYAMAINTTGDGDSKAQAQNVLMQGVQEAYKDVNSQWKKFSELIYGKLLDKYK